MAGRRKEQVVASGALVASAVTLGGQGKVESVYMPMQEWQSEAWDYYDITPELRFAANWVANALSRCTLEPGQLDTLRRAIKTEDAAITKALDQIFGNSEGQGEMMAAFGLHLTVAGEAYLVGRKAPSGMQMPEGSDGKLWEVVGVRELSKSAGGWTVKSNVDGAILNLADGDTVIRIWRSHPAYRHQADSPIRALLPVLSEIKYLTLHIFAQTISRLAGNGLMVLPKSVEIPGINLDPEKKGDGIVKALSDLMSKAIQTPGSAASQVPLFMLVADDAVDKIGKPITFWTEFDEKASDARKAAIHRFAVGFDLPPEVISGMSGNMSTSGGRGTGLSHWGQWQIEESAIKMHIEPLLDVIINGLVLRYIRPVTNNPRATLVANTTALKLQPDRSKEASEAYLAGAISEAGYLFYNGLDPTYAVKPEDIKKRILWKLASGSASPEMVLAAAKEQGVDLGLTIEDVRGTQAAPQVPSDPSLEGHPTRTIPDRTAALLPVAESFVIRALERAGGRLRNMGVRPPDVAQQNIYQFAEVNGSAGKLLEDAWTHVPSVCGEMCDTAKLTTALQAYTESLLATKASHSRQALARYLQLVD